MSNRPVFALRLIIVVALLVSGCAATPELIQTEASLSIDPEMDRATAIGRFEALSFLPTTEATCVVDAVFAATGTYNPSSEQGEGAVETSVQGCTEFDAAERPDGLADEGNLEIVELELETGAIEASFELTADSMPAITPGGLATGDVTLNGTNVKYVTITPQGFQPGDAAPVFLAFPPGGQNLDITKNVAEVMYLNQAVGRGWVVITPAAPGELWHQGAEDLIPEMLRWIRAWVTVEGARPHLGGMSNGGISAFRIAAENPNRFRSIMAYPGFPSSPSDQAALAELTDIPVRLWVGGNDSDGWKTSLQSTADELAALGGDVRLKILPGEPHVLQSTTDGSAVFNELDAAR